MNVFRIGLSGLYAAAITLGLASGSAMAHEERQSQEAGI